MDMETTDHATYYRSPQIRVGAGASIAERLQLAWASDPRRRQRGRQSALAAGMNVGPSHVCQILAGKKPCSPDAARNAAKHLHVKIRWLVHGDVRHAPYEQIRELRDGVDVMNILRGIAYWLQHLAPISCPNTLPEWIRRHPLLSRGAPHPDVPAEDWVQANAFISSVSGSPRMTTREADDFGREYRALLCHLRDEVTVTLPGHAWQVIQAAVRDTYSPEVEWRYQHAEPGPQPGNCPRLPDRLRNELLQVPGLGWMALLDEESDEAAHRPPD